MFGHFEIEQLIPLFIAIPFFVASVFSFHLRKRLCLLFLFVGTLILGYFMANLDPFLNIWDEQYHALVAKNLSIDPFKPILLAENHFETHYTNWTANHIWLHKQPLFLWQMALSIKLFGANEIAIRIPSILMHAIIPLFIYRIGSISLSQRTGFIAALLFATAYFPLELIVGKYSTDHNDLAFLFYVTASFWAWFEYHSSQKKYWLILIGIFSGGAVLVKWLTGLLIYFCWGLMLVFTKKRQVIKPENILPITYSFLIAVAVFLPWQLYIHSQFPTEAQYELSLNAQHFFSSIESHSGGWSFHFTDGIKSLYGAGTLTPFILLASVIFLFVRLKLNEHKLMISIAIVFTYMFFTLAATKMIAFTIIVTPFIYLALASLINYLLDKIEAKFKRPNLFVSFFGLSMLFLCYSVIHFNKIQNYHTMWKPNDNNKRALDIKEMKFIRALQKQFPEEKLILFNANIKLNGHIPIMFYTDHIAYNFIPKEDEFARLKNSTKRIAIIDDGNLPHYVKEDESIIKLKL